MPAHLQYHGNQGLVVRHKGVLNTDRFGLDTATAIWSLPMDQIGGGPELGSRHPVWSYLTMEKRQINIEPGFLIITGEYVGITGGRTSSIYECSYGSADEPIQTHKKFVTHIAGKPSAPLNGAIFVDFETQKKTTDDARGVFTEFQTVVNGALNPFAGVTSYLSTQITLRETWIATSPVVASGLDQISSPPIFVQVSSGVDWIFAGASFQKRGLIYVNSKEWKASGPRGWNDIIYSF